MPIDPFAVLNALLRAEAARSAEHETESPKTTPAATPQGPTEPRPRPDEHDTL